jgi:hypothetical protein
MADLFTWLGSNDKIVAMIFAFIGWVIAGALAWNNIRWRIRILENNQDGFKTILEKQVQITRDVELNSVELKQIAKATERRLQLIEDRMK